jgi:DNA-binding response OmpR family regulator
MFPKLLVVDDEPQIRDLLKDYFVDCFVVESAQNGKEAVEKVNLWKPDIILMDFMMPVMDGLAASKAIRDQDFTRHIPILMLTAVNDTDDRVNAFNLGVAVEYGILKLLMNCLEQVVSREKIMQHVWEDESKSNRLIDAHITSLRKKIKNFDGEFQTVYGSGYRLKKEKT